MTQQLMAMHEPLALAYLQARLDITADERKEARLSYAEMGAEENNFYTIESGVATMNIVGALNRNGPDFIDVYFGFKVTGYNQIIKASAELKENVLVERVEIQMDTGGGYVDGLDEAYQALDELNKVKRVSVFNRGMIASAGYYLAVAGTEILAVSPAVETGSIGVKVVGYDWSGYLKDVGIKKVVILSSGAPNKAPGVDSAKGISEIQKNLDAQERIFHMRVSEGRGVDVDVVQSDFGQGAVMVAFDPDPTVNDALSVGMIDEVVGGQIGVFESDPDLDQDEANLSSKRSQSGRSVDGQHQSERKQKKRSPAPVSEMETHIVSDNLEKLLAENPGASAEHDAAVASAKAEGKVEGQADAEAAIAKRVKAASSVLSAETSYPKTVMDLASQVMIGEAEASTLSAAVAAVDAVREEAASADAGDESEAIGGSDAQIQTPGKVDGVAQTNEDFEAQLAKTKKQGA